MYSIGVFSTEQSLHNILSIDSDMQKYGNITYLPYTTFQQLEYLYEKNIDNFDAVIFSGSYPYKIIERRFGQPSKPYTYFDISDRDYYKIIAKIAVNRPSLSFSRVYFDKPEIYFNFSEIFDDKNMPKIDSASIDWGTENPSEWYKPLKEYYKKVWDSGEVDLLVTRFGSMESYFKEQHICHEFLYPSAQSMLDSFYSLLLKLREVTNHGSAVAIGLITSNININDMQKKELLNRLNNCNKQFGMSFLIYEHESRLEITTNLAVLKELTQHYTTCPVTTYLEAGVDFPICLGWGCASNAIDAYKNAQRALKEALLSQGSAAFIVTDDNMIVGPLSSIRRISYSDSPNEYIDQICQSVQLSPLYVSKILSVMKQKGTNAITASELAFYLNITTRSASRILNKLVEGEYAKVDYNRQINLRGRPAKIYTLLL